ncbi:Stemmadenine O-acetyltransferase [Camellia lanceoleosa]|uniref:Stemmadenine O-acetyltransferase n=1 Tax=Camellia lanceoleosa TaxID=1840588 RepID=A0ACC0G433_9ERIC|nr:Stemmadenine O-acetyltransferase [Camellia lanceoleosa]
MEVVVISRDTIKPSLPTPLHLRHVKLSFLDQLSQKIFSPFIYCYTSDSSFNFARLKKSLSEILTGFYPLAGRLKDDLFVDCNDNGVDFFQAQVNCKLSRLIERPDYVEIKKLLPYPEMDDCGDKLLAIQVNIFECNGIAIGLCFARKVFDGLSIFTFVNNWAAKARDADSNLIPYPKFDLAKLFPPREMPGYKVVSLTAEEKKMVYGAKRFVFSANAVAALKAMYAANHSHLHPPPSRVESVSAFIWSRFMVATQGDKARQVGKSYRVVQAVNLRWRANPPLLETCLGNPSRFAMTVPSMEGTAEDGFGLITQMREAIKMIDGDYVKELQEGNPIPKANQLDGKFKKGEKIGTFFTFTSVSRYPIYEADFGFGQPIWVTMGAQPIGNVVILMPTRSDDMQALINMKRDELAKLEADKVFQAFVSPTFDAKFLLHSSL